MTFLVVFLVMVLVVGMMAIGVIMGRKPIAGSCGGSREKCEEVNRDKSEAPNTDLAYDASKR